VAVVVHVRDGLDVDLSEVLVKSRVGAFGAEGEEVFEGGAHLEDVVLVAADGELLDRRAREGGEGVDDVFDGEKRGEMDLAQLAERGLLGLLKGLSGEGSVEGELVEGGANVANDVLRADAVDVRGLVVTASEIEELEGAVDGHEGLVWVAKVDVADLELAEGGEVEERG
jgi:riboflavin biosynthesis pyrimidine reductase